MEMAVHDRTRPLVERASCQGARLTIDRLGVAYQTAGGIADAINEVSFDVPAG